MSEARHVIRMIRRAPVADVAILMITFGLTVAADLVIAVNVGVLLATVHFLHRMSSAVEVHRTDHDISPQDLPGGVAMYSIQGPFFFAAVESFERALAQTHTDPQAIIIRLGNVPFMDITGIETLQEIRDDFEQRGVGVVFTEARQQVLERLVRGGVIVEGEMSNYRPEVASALALTRDHPE
jgi:SulP family sulfate permease